MEKLLQHGADIYAARADGMAPIHIAAQRGYTPIAHQILQQQSGIDIVNDRDKKAALAPIQYAGMNKQSEMVKFLLLRYVNFAAYLYKYENINYTYICITLQMAYFVFWHCP